MSNFDSGKVISGDSQTAYERWEAPHVKNIQQRKDEQAGRVTARQLEELQKQAYDEGFQLGRKEGHENGLAQGLEEGREHGLKNGQEEILQMVKRFEQIIQLLAEPLNQVDQQVEGELLALSVATARQIIRREISVNPEQIVAVVKEAISVLPSGSKKIKVHLNPDDAEIIRETLISNSENSVNEINQTTPADDAWSIIEEPTLNRGGCQIKTETSQIDATIETRIAEIAARIFGDERAGDEKTDKESAADSADVIMQGNEKNSVLNPETNNGD
ncbi:MAG: flagellar assembly protein FliH [gamma proteobacterium symbiont of Taylorina sp.]|nr:flagellar assembly protein FliH [gamma proteobacterium symbiont of Taylorina sp.]